jgi:hypothetical protein
MEVFSFEVSMKLQFEIKKPVKMVQTNWILEVEKIKL